jgi:hypothetical protein
MNTHTAVHNNIAARRATNYIGNPPENGAQLRCILAASLGAFAA